MGSVPPENGGGGGGGGGGNGSPTGWVGPWNVLGIGVRDDKPSPRDIRRRTPALALEATLVANLAARTKPESAKYEANVNRLRAIREIIAVAGQLGIDPNRQTRRVVREIQRSLGVPLNLRAIEKGNAPDVFVNLAGVTAAIAAEQIFRASPPSGGGTFPGEAAPTPNGTTQQPAPTPQPSGAPPGLPSGWWDWQLWQRALFGAGTLARNVLGRPTSSAGAPTFVFNPPAVFNPQPLPPPGVGTQIPIGGAGMPLNLMSGTEDSVWGNLSSGDWWGVVEAGIDLAQDVFFPGIPSDQQVGIPNVPSLIQRFVNPQTGGTEGRMDVSDLLGAPQLFRATEARVIPKSRIDAVGPDGRCHTWFRAVPYGWKVKGTRVGMRKRHHHHRRPY